MTRSQLAATGLLVALSVGASAALPLLTGAAEAPAHPAGPRAGDIVLADALIDAGQLSRRTQVDELLLPLPPPTENWLDHDAEQDQKKARKAWMAQMRKGAPGVDWKLVEKDNGLHQTARRNAMVGLPPPAEGDPDWVERGSINQAGRMMVARLTSEDTLYTGSSLGGVWRGAADGTGWEPLGDNLYGGAHWLEVAELGGGNTIFAATDGGLVHWSVDEGTTWNEPTGLPAMSSIRRLLKLQDGSEELYLLGYDGTYALFSSEDGGQSWAELVDLGTFAGDLWAPRDGDTTLYLATTAGLERSEDLGDSWSLVGSWGGTPGRVELVGSEAGAPTLYAAVDGSTLHRSDDAGLTWASVHSFVEYWGAMNASVQDPGVVVYGGVNAYRSTNGADFTMINGWWEYYGDPANLLHADNMGIDVQLDAAGDEVWYINTDGGTYASYDRVATVQNLSLEGLRVSQYYSTLTDVEDPQYVAAGAQDQGYQITGALAQDGDILRFDQVLSGDYAQMVSGDGTHDFVFSVYPGFILVQKGAEAPELSYLDFPAGENYSWLPPLAPEPYSKRAFFFCATKLYRYALAGGTWQATLWSDQDFAASSGEYLSGVVFSPVDPERAYATTNHGRVFWSDDHGVTWEESASRVAWPQYLSGNALEPSLTDLDTVTIGGSGYGVPAVYRSEDGAKTFQDWSQGIGDTLVYSLAEAPDGSGTILAGTQTTVFRRDPGDTEWTDVSDSTAPVTIYWSAEALAQENTVRFGTYGRGIWDYRLDPDHLGCFPVQDYDGDGVDCDEDCNDHEAGILPGAEEVCDNGIDEDCDGEDLACGGEEGGSSEEEGSVGGEGGGGSGDEDPEEGRSRGCGCTTGLTAPLGLAWMGPLGLLGLLRRRRQGQRP